MCLMLLLYGSIVNTDTLKEKSGMNRSIALFFKLSECCWLEKQGENVIGLQHRLNIESAVDTK